MSRGPKLTPWFPADVKPARPGLYDCWEIGCEYPSCWRWFWDGESWCNDGLDRWPCLNQQRRWRGLAENPAPGATPE